MKLTWNLWMVLLLAVAFAACDTNKATEVAENEAETTENVASEENAATELAGENFGAEFAAAEIVNYTDFAAEIGAEDSLQVQLRGTVDEVCQAKGCWMTIAGKEGDEEMMVRFKDYGFFMPKDIAGREVVMNGLAFYQMTSVDELRHYAEDAGKSEEEIAAITEPKRELRFLADGVVLVEK